MPPAMPLVGIVGKTNVGKSTFFAAATLITVKIENRPFVTIKPNIGIGYVRKECAHKKLGLPKCNPVNSLCINGERFIPIKLMDVAGLVRGAHRGRGLGNKFLDDLRQADVLLHVVDVAGSTDEEGRPVKPGFHDPLKDIFDIENEINEWFYTILSKNWPKLARTLDTLPLGDAIDLLAQRLSGLSIRRSHIAEALRVTKLNNVKPSSWKEEELRLFTRKLREVSKPILIVANKIDLPEGEENYKRIVKELGNERAIIPVSSEYELALRRAAKAGLIKYLPGNNRFEISNFNRLSSLQLKALKRIEEFLNKWGSTGVQLALNEAIFKLLRMIVVYPVEDPVKFTDTKGNVLPDAYLVKEGTTARELAYMVHTDLGKGFIYAIDAKTKKKIGEKHVINDGDVIKIVSSI